MNTHSQTTPDITLVDHLAWPRISVIVPSADEQGLTTLRQALAAMDYPQDKIEVLLALGHSPSTQRNLAVSRATGDVLVFFNKDSRPRPDHFKCLTTLLRQHPEIAVVGGPDMTPANNSTLQHLFGYAMQSPFAHSKMRARYNAFGSLRATDERELILSNLAIRKNVFVNMEGFNESLWPNEENEFLNRLQHSGLDLAYEPKLIVDRDKRRSLTGFMNQFFRYGRGRMTQMMLEGLGGNVVFFAPLLFAFYLLCLPALQMLSGWAMLPLALYAGFAIADAAKVSLTHRRLWFTPILPALYFCMHMSYAFGMFTEAMLRAIAGKSKNTADRQHPNQVTVVPLQSMPGETRLAPITRNFNRDKA